MRFCQDHWDALRQRISDRGLDHLVARGGAAAGRQMKDQLESGEVALRNFDPLMSAHWAIANNVMDVVSRAGGSPLYLMSADDVPEDPVDPVMIARARTRGLEVESGLTWPRCPLCYLNLAHKLTCSDRRCILDIEHGYDWMLDRAADDAKQKAGELERAA